MAVVNKELIGAKAKIFKALGHPTRLMIVEKLAKGECCVCELVDMVEADYSTVSRHLSVLKEAGIIQDDKRGQKIFYCLKFPCVINFNECVENLLRAKVAEKVTMLK